MAQGNGVFIKFLNNIGVVMIYVFWYKYGKMFICVVNIEILQDCLIDVLWYLYSFVFFIQKKGFVLNLCIKSRCYICRFFNFAK